MKNIQDEKDLIEREWSNAKFIGSCFAGKGVRSIDEKDKSRKENERVEREELKMKVLHNYLNRSLGEEMAPETVTLPDGRQAEVVKRFKADSVEELADQLSASLSEEKDYHDLVIEAKEREVANRIQKIEEQRRLLFEKSRSDIRIDGSNRILGGREEAEAYLKRMENMRMENMNNSRRLLLPGESEETSDKQGS